MGEENCWEREVVITELTKGRELMCQLQKHFDPMKQDVCQYLSVEILSSYDKALSLLNGTALSVMSKGKQIINSAPSSSTAKLESPHLPVDSSTKSSDRPSNSRKRKMISRRTEYVHARSREEVPPEDGYSWRKYGQKHILGAKYPREYYRCARRHLSKCIATKMVKRSDTEPPIFEVIYGESHSCGQESKNQNEDLPAPVLTVLTKEKQSEEVGRRGEISESDIAEMVSTPNNSFNNSSTDSPLYLMMDLKMLAALIKVSISSPHQLQSAICYLMIVSLPYLIVHLKMRGASIEVSASVLGGNGQLTSAIPSVVLASGLALLTILMMLLWLTMMPPIDCTGKMPESTSLSVT
uniref:Probable WRKY transcription factor 41 isoform X3 n=1 Tax=Nicotiana tabacum TaxID=4097 RepID=A0A1S4AVF5_TOBAC|nr:PREDICTED: probable WRKY transcription factor 41 isoform X3 [Nicotiana tabacum]